MKSSHFLKQLAVDFLQAIPESGEQEEVLREARQVSSLHSFVQSVRRLQEERGIVKVITVVSAIPLAAHDRDALLKRMKERWHMPIQLEERLDPSVIGGLRLTAEDWEYDATIKGRLQRLQHAFTS